MGTAGLMDDLGPRLSALAGPKADGEDFGAWIAYLVHEIRSPLSVISNSNQIIQTGPLTNEQRKACARIARQSEFLARLGSDLSEFASGGAGIKRDVVTFYRLWSAAKEAVYPLIESKHQELSENIPSEPLWIWGDQQRLIQVFTNLLSNAAKYTPEGGTLEVSARADGEHLAFSLRDNGSGIPTEELPHIFELFYRGRTAQRNSEEQGTGLGLAIVRRFVELHGGSIHATSEGIGKGTEFTVRLPLSLECGSPI